LADEPIRARPVGRLERGWRWCRRNPGLATLLGTVVTLLAVGAVGGLALSLRLRAAPGQAGPGPEPAEGPPGRAGEAERGGRGRPCRPSPAEAGPRRCGGGAGQRSRPLEALPKAAGLARERHKPAATFDELRNLALAALALPDVRLLKDWPGWPEGSHS